MTPAQHLIQNRGATVVSVMTGSWGRGYIVCISRTLLGTPGSVGPEPDDFSLLFLNSFQLHVSQYENKNIL